MRAAPPAAVQPPPFPPRPPAPGPAASRRTAEALGGISVQSSLSGGRDDATVLVAKPLFFAERYQPPNPLDGDRQLRAQRRRRRAAAIAGAILAITLAALGTWQLATSMNGGAAAAVSSSSH